MNLKVDLWGCAILRCPAERFLPPLPSQKNDTFPKKCDFVRLPDIGAYRFLADPFGIWVNGLLFVFAEAYDYRNRRGRIDLFIYDENLNLRKEIRPVLRENWHLSYPYIFKHDGAFYMLPEAWKSGKLTLYRAKNFPLNWEPVKEFQFPEISAIDATPLFYKGKCWLFWTHPDPRNRRLSDLHLSVADDLFGKWNYQGMIRRDGRGCRAGGRPLLRTNQSGGKSIYLPTQASEGTYGSGLYFLEIANLESRSPYFIRHKPIALPSDVTEGNKEGFHTLSSAGEVTLVDFKHFVSMPGSVATRLLSKINPFHTPF